MKLFSLFIPLFIPLKPTIKIFLITDAVVLEMLCKYEITKYFLLLESIVDSIFARL